MNNHHRLLPATLTLVLLLFAVVLSLLWAAESLVAQPPAAAEIYQDFRNKRPISDAFRLGGFDPESEIKTENEGLRITLPAERGQHFLSEINANIVITGDFEFTATYEILSAAPPLTGYGVGVNLTVSTAEPSKKFGKLCRVLRPKEGSVYLAESWPKYQMRTRDTGAMGGQLRLARIGAALVFLISDGAGQEFQEIWELADYGRDDIGYAGFQVSDGGEPGNPVDARLIDLRLRLGKIERDKVTAPASLAAPEPPDRDAWDDLPRWLIAFVLVGVGTLVFLIVAVAVVLFSRRPKPATQEPANVKKDPFGPSAGVLVFHCSKCGKQIMAKTALIGKRIKCPHCGTAKLVPDAEAGEA